jgi:hypothetical protein
VQGLSVKVVGAGIVGSEPRAFFILPDRAFEVSDLRKGQPQKQAGPGVVRLLPGKLAGERTERRPGVLLRPRVTLFLVRQLEQPVMLHIRLAIVAFQK